MMRNYALTFLAVTSRVLVPLFLLAQVPFSDTVNAVSISANAQSAIRSVRCSGGSSISSWWRS